MQQGTLQVPAVNNAGTNGPLGRNTSVALGTAGQSGAGQPIGTLEYTGGTASSTMPFTLPTSNGAIQIDNASTNLTLTGTIGVSGEFIKTGPGTLTLTANPTLNANSLLQVNGGTLRFSNSGAATIGTGVTSTVASGATLELAGSVSALSSGSHRVNITNNSSSPGLLVSGTHQQVGNIDGSGTTQVNAGSDLTANHIIQSALVIGGTAGSFGTVTIAASDANGNSLEITPDGSFSDLPPSAASFNGDSFPLPASGATQSDNPLGPSAGSRQAVPEPATLLLSALAGLACLGWTRRHRVNSIV